MYRILVLFLFLSLSALPQVNRTADSLLNLLEKSDDDTQKYRLEELIIELMYTTPYDEARSLSNRLLDDAKGLSDRSLEIKVLIHSYRFHQFEEKMRLLNRAIYLISESGDQSMLPHAYVFKALAFRDNSMADSAMIYILKAKDILDNSANTEDMLSPLMLIADMHYYAGEYEQARELYQKIKRQFPEVQKNHNYRIIENNLGLVELGLKNYHTAEGHFLNSAAHLKKIKAEYADSAGLPYIYRKLMETNILKGDMNRAAMFCDLGIRMAEYFRAESELPGLYSGKGVILYKQGKNEASLENLRKGEILEAQYPDLKYRIDLYKAFADTWTALGNYREANRYLNLYSGERAKADSLFNTSKILYLLADRNYKMAVKHISGLERERILYIVIMGILVSSISVLYIYSSRLRRANKILVEKSLRIAYSLAQGESDRPDDTQSYPMTPEVSNDAETDERKQRAVDDEKLIKIASDLDHLVSEKRIYLDPDLTIVSLAEMLGTNRTYLVQAIKRKHGLNFLDFINGHRVAAAIRLLDSERAKSLSIDGIAGLAGFNNRVTFAKVFKQSTGMSPSIFMRSVSEMRKHAENEEASNSPDQES